MLVRVLLWINIIGFLSYGLFCFFLPANAAAIMGYVLSNGDAVIEVSAMYGGVQFMIGLFCLVSLRSDLGEAPALLIQLMVYAGLVMGRVYGYLTLNTGVSFYTIGASSFELLMLLLLGYCFVKSKKLRS